MKSNSYLKKLEMYLVGGVAGALVVGIVYALSTPFSAEDFGTSSEVSKSAATSPQPDHALQFEPALRTLDGVIHHG